MCVFLGGAVNFGGILAYSYGVWGSAVSSPAVSGAEPQPTSNLVQFRCKI